MLFETERLTISLVSYADNAFALKLLNEPSFLTNIGDKAVRNLEDANGYLEKGPMASYAQHGFGLWRVGLKQDGTAIGMAGLLKRDNLDHADIGYAFLPEYWGKGYALEANAAVLDYGRNQLQLGTILAMVSEHNAPSINLLLKLNFVFERWYRYENESEEIKLYANYGPDKPSPDKPGKLS